MRGQLWPVLQQAVACALAWWAARLLFDHHLPLFAPMAAVVALNTPVGGRGTNAVRVVLGVVWGVLIGQGAYTVFGHHYGALAVGCAVLLSLLVTLALDGERVTMAQAAASAVIALASGREAGIDRVLDVLVGAGVALVFSQLLFPAHPLKLLRAAEAETFHGLAGLLRLGARADAGDPDLLLPLESHALYRLLTDVDRARTDMVEVARRTPRWRRQRHSVRASSGAALRLGVLANSCFTLARFTADAEGPDRQALLPVVEALARTLSAYAAAEPGRAAREACVRGALAAAAQAPPQQGPPTEAVRLAVCDLLVVAGVAADAAATAVDARAPDAPQAPPAA
ncbi:FUSC family protein [Kitasatospora sp. NPDC088134]|uniref:FUSC family protein n=1 Tax=Kitasatospora sp. NPDC088134 TaxID=3364071 RepID=UPI0038267ADE